MLLILTYYQNNDKQCVDNFKSTIFYSLLTVNTCFIIINEMCLELKVQQFELIGYGLETHVCYNKSPQPIQYRAVNGQNIIVKSIAETLLGTGIIVA